MKRPILQNILVGFGLMLFTLLVFWPATHGEFLNYDDQEYVTNNPRVRDGLTWNGFFWAMSSGHGANWHPLTWLSHMLDWQVFGDRPAGHHFTSIALHALNTALLFAGLLAATGSRGRAATVA